MAPHDAGLKNVRSWKLNKKEQEEVKARVAKGECGDKVKYELQLKKAQACEAKKAASAVAERAQSQHQKPGRGQVPEETAPAGGPNHGYYTELHGAVQKILKEFPGMEACDPLPLALAEGDKGGVQAPYNAEHGAKALQEHGVYRCSISVWSLNVWSSATPDIPLSQERVLQLGSFLYGENGEAPAHMTSKQVEVMASSADLARKPQELQMVSPEELVHSMLFSCAMAIDSDAWVNVKEQWKAVLLSVPAAFLLMNKSKLWLEAFNRRQETVQLHESMSRTGLQLAMELMGMRQLLESLGLQKLKEPQMVVELTKMGCKNVISGRKTTGKDEEEGCLTANMLRSAALVHKHVLAHANCVALLMQLENEFGTRSPFHRITALAVLATKPSSNAMREWCLRCIVDALFFGGQAPRDISRNNLSGDKHHCGWIALWELKFKATRTKEPCASVKLDK